MNEGTNPTGIGKTKNGKKLHILVTINGKKRILCRPRTDRYEIYEITTKSFEDIDCKHCSEYYKILQSNELDEALKELDRREKAVLQQRDFVTQLERQCNTEWGICNTVFKQLALQPSFDINNLDKNDKFRIESLLEKNKIENITIRIDAYFDRMGLGYPNPYE